MTDSPTPSLIQRRMALTRRRNSAVFICAAVVFALSIQIARLVETAGDSIWQWFSVILFAVLAGMAVRSIVRAVRAIRAFEQENGSDAGRQKPVGQR